MGGKVSFCTRLFSHYSWWSYGRHTNKYDFYIRRGNEYENGRFGPKIFESYLTDEEAVKFISNVRKGGCPTCGHVDNCPEFRGYKNVQMPKLDDKGKMNL